MLFSVWKTTFIFLDNVRTRLTQNSLQSRNYWELSDVLDVTVTSKSRSLFAKFTCWFWVTLEKRVGQAWSILGDLLWSLSRHLSHFAWFGWLWIQLEWFTNVITVFLLTYLTVWEFSGYNKGWILINTLQ